MKFGKLNIIVGGVVIILSSLGGFALGFSMDPFFERGFYAIPLERVFLKPDILMVCPLLFII